MKNISKRYENKIILDNICLDIFEGEILGLSGSNGAGKTTLLKIMGNLLTQDAGEIIYSKKIQTEMLLEGSRNFYWNLTGYENLIYFSTIFGIKNKREISKRIIKLLNLEDFINELSGSYSRGMQQKLSLGISLLNNPDLLLMDEPTNGLDEDSVKHLTSVLHKLNKEWNITIIIVSHDRNFLHNTIHREVLLENRILSPIHKSVATIGSIR
ncbi:ABC transporter ATP-binding protein [Niallia sp. XMNu-256]|uniref:ABC transporter ATP-binding protein n=1 Tax=Niallia sp. XMNu-256 TaxID=3082444 RepID=UPI0030D01661